MSPLISIVITVHNQERHLGAAIESVLQQTFSDYELLIWDDGSDDRSVAIADSYEKQDQRVTVVTTAPRGRIAALQAAIAHTRGTYVGWIDSDGLLVPTAIEQLVTVLEGSPNLGCVYSDYLTINEQGEIINAAPSGGQLFSFMTTCFRLLRRSTYQQAGGIDASTLFYLEDCNLFSRLAAVAGVQRISQPLYYCRQHSETVASQFPHHTNACQIVDRLVVQVEVSDRAVTDGQSPDQMPMNVSILPIQHKSVRRWVVPPVASLFVAFTLVGAVCAGFAQAQSITPAVDGTNTLITPSGNRYDISGGTQTGSNLFQSFQKFGLNSGEIANFLANPQIQNILGRVTGGDASLINGLMQVSNSSANLFLMNPAGIVFGPNASLNVAGAFTATTATGIGFGNSWFDAIGSNNYPALLGDPTAFAFATPLPGSIINAGNLTVASGQALNLLGGTVINTGQLSAPGGQLTIAAIPGEKLVRLTQPGSLLSFDIAPLNSASLPNTWTAPIASLPQLLTGGNLMDATGVTVNPDGSIRLASAPQQSIPVNSGTAIASGSMNVSGPTAGTAQVLGDRVGLVNANINASSDASGGRVLIGGGYQGVGAVPNAANTFVDGSSVISADSLFNGAGGQVVVWADQNTQFFGSIRARGGVNSGNGGSVEVSGKNNLNYQGSVDASAPAGNPGTLLLDPTNITISAGTGSSGFTGQVAFDDPGPTTIFESELEALATSSAPTNVVIQATNSITFQPFEDGVLDFGFGAASLNFTAGGAITMNSTDTILASGRPVTFTAGSLSLGNIDTSGDDIGGNINLTSTSGSVRAGELNTSSGNGEAFTATSGSVTVNSARDIVLDSINTEAFAAPIEGDGFSAAGNVTLTTNGSGVIRIIGTLSDSGGASISTNSINRSGVVDSGEITITHGGGNNNVPFTIGDSSVNGSAGAMNAGGSSILSIGSFSVAPSGDSATPAPGITINSINAPPTLTATSTLSGALQNTPFNISYADLAPNAADPNLDNTVIRIVSIAPGATLTLNGSPVIPGVTTIVPGDVLVYTPPAGTVGSLNAFTIVASDFRVAANDVLSNSAPVSIAVNVTASTSDNPVNNPVDNPVNNPVDNSDISNPCVLTSCNTVDIQPGPGTLPDLQLNPDIPEAIFTREFETYLGLTNIPIKTIDQQQQVAQEIEQATGAKPAFVYVNFVPASLPADEPTNGIKQQTDETINERSTDQLEIVVITARGNPIRKRISTATRAKALLLAQQFRNEVSDPRKTRSSTYLPLSRQLYQWMIEPISADLKTREITNLVFIMDAGLRSLPVAALHDGQRFLVEQYSLGVMPSFSLTDTRYRNLQGTSVLSMGISESTQDQPRLPAVPIEISTIVGQLWSGQALLNSDATLENVKAVRRQQPFGIVHLATHADFQSGALNNSYIQFWNEKLRLDQIRQLGLNNPQVDLLVLSACATALGDREAELGFGGLAVKTGVKTAVASLWYVNDAATTALMTGFYSNLRSAKIKAQALQQAQLAMARGQVYLENNRLRGTQPGEGIPLPADSLTIRDSKLLHPYYWAAFTMIGSPW